MPLPDIADRIATVTLNRDEKRNALWRIEFRETCFSRRKSNPGRAPGVR